MISTNALLIVGLLATLGYSQRPDLSAYEKVGRKFILTYTFNSSKTVFVYCVQQLWFIWYSF